MSGERLAELAVDATADWLGAQLQTYLTAVETARSLTAGTLAPPATTQRADLPEYGGATPILEVFEISGKREDAAGPASKLWVFMLGVIFTIASDADVEAGHQKIRDTLTAISDCFDADGTLGGRINGKARIRAASFAHGRGSDARHLQHVAIDLEVRLFDA